ncbi:hypothetical protein BD770DRAFT_397535 [Pilaira anomala]|nr:hypothetical protein BD770DRAFT_397535 [Pilaira anomala]
MQITYKIPDFPEPGDNDLSKGICESNKGNYKKAQSYFEKSATYGNEYGQLFSGLIHFGGYNPFNRDKTKALNYFQAAESEWQNSVAQFFLGLMYLAGDAVTLNKEQGLLWIEKAAKNGFHTARSYIAKIYLEGDEGAEKNLEKSFFWFKQLVDSETYNSRTLYLFDSVQFKVNFDGSTLNNPFKLEQKSMQAPVYLSPTYLTKYSKRKTSNQMGIKFNSSILWYILSNNVFSVSMCHFYIGLIYLDGYSGFLKNHRKSFEFFERCSRYNNPIAFRYMGQLYFKGEGVRKDDKEAMRCHKKGKDLGDIESIHHLAVCFFLGEVVKQNFKKAREYLELYIKHKDIADQLGKAYFTLGCIYRMGGEGVKQDNLLAIDYYKKSVELGSGMGAYGLGEMYEYGQGVKKNKKTAYEWYVKATSLGCFIAYMSLGQLELQSPKTTDSVERALLYFRQAERHGMEDFKKKKTHSK